MLNRRRVLYRAELAECAGRTAEMWNHMRVLAETTDVLSADERRMFAVAARGLVSNSHGKWSVRSDFCVSVCGGAAVIVVVVLTLALTHTHTNIRTHTHTHTLTRTLSSLFSLFSLTHTYSLSHSHAHSRSQSLTLTQRLTRTHTRSHGHIHTHAHTLRNIVFHSLAVRCLVARRWTLRASRTAT
jgi:hypothetical protein